MAWRCSGRTNDELIEKLRSEGLIQNEKVANAMRKVDRRNYVPDPSHAYIDSPQTIGYGATISAPHMHAHACENLLPLIEQANKKRGTILDVGSGSGYLTAVLRHLAPDAKVIGIDHLPGLTELSKTNLKKDGLDVSAPGSQIDIILGDGRKGSIEYAPFQVIHVGAAAPTMPQDLVDQLDKPGRMFIPVGEYTQDIWQVDKLENGEVKKEKLFGVRYVPLTDAHKQWEG